MIENLQTENVFRSHFISWRILGFLPTKKYRRLYLFYSIVLNVVVTVGYPLHLMIGLFQSRTMYDIIKILAINLTCLVCSIKTVVIWLKFQNIQEIFAIIRRQDKRICLAKDEAHYYKSIAYKNVRQVLKMFNILYLASWVLVELSVLVNGFMGNWMLMYPAYFPIDPYANTKLYILAHVYQLFGVTVQILQDIVDDSFAAMHLALLSGQIHTLSIRISKLGRDKNKSRDKNNQELLECIQDHKDLLLYRKQLEEITSFYMFLQILITSINMCATIVFVILFVSDPFTLIYYFVYFLAMTGEIMPVCYYATIMELEFRNLTNAIFSSNWIEQDGKFKTNLRIFAEITKKPLNIEAWLFRINLNSFLTTCKNSYSLFALIMEMK